VQSLLVYPRYKYETLVTTDEPLGILYIGAVLRKAGYTPRFFDLTFEDSLTPLLDAAKRSDCIAFSATTQLFRRAREILHEVRRANPSIRSVIGGPHATAFVEDALSAFDMAVVGEGENTILDLFRVLDQGGNIADVPGLAFREDGEVVINSPRPFVKDLDDIPFPRRDWADYSKYRRVGLIATRGCPHRCLFCKPMQDRLFGKRIRSRSPQNVVEEIETLVTAYPKRILSFKDDMLTVNPTSWFQELSQRLKEKRLRIRWQCNSRVNAVNYEKLSSMKAAGCYHIYFGVESGSQRILDFYRKDTTVEQAIQAFDWCHQLKILANASVILGAPDETSEELDQPFQLIKRIKPYNWLVHVATPFPGNWLYDYARENQILSDHYRYDEMEPTTNLYEGKLPMRLKQLTAGDVIEYQKKIDRYMRKRFLLKSALMPLLWKELLTSSGTRRSARMLLRKHFVRFPRNPSTPFC